MSGRRDKQEVGMGDRKKCEGRERTLNTNPAVLVLEDHQATPKARQNSGLLRFKQKAGEYGSS